MKLMFLGDIVGKAGRDVVVAEAAVRHVRDPAADQAVVEPLAAEHSFAQPAPQIHDGGGSHADKKYNR